MSLHSALKAEETEIAIKLLKTWVSLWIVSIMMQQTQPSIVHSQSFEEFSIIYEKKNPKNQNFKSLKGGL